MSDCTKACKEREIIPDAIEGIREARMTAGAIDSQIWRLERAAGRDRSKGYTEALQKPEPPLYEKLTSSIMELNQELHHIHEKLTHEVILLLGEN